MQTQFCKPAPQTVHFDTHIFADQKSQPVHAEKTFDGYRTTGISFEDYTSMNIRVRKQSNERRVATPVWAVNTEALRTLLVRFMEGRAGWAQVVRTGTLKDRLDEAITRVKGKRERIDTLLTQLCHKYVAEKNSPNPDRERLRGLAVEIEGMDTLLMHFSDGGAALVAAIIYLYYRARLNSVGVAEHLHIKPPHVRTILFRLHKVWDRMMHNRVDATRRVLSTADRIKLRQNRSALRAAKEAEREQRRAEKNRLIQVREEERLARLQAREAERQARAAARVHLEIQAGIERRRAAENRTTVGRRGSVVARPRLSSTWPNGTPVDKSEVVALHKSGLSLRRIAEHFGYPANKGSNRVSNYLMQVGAMPLRPSASVRVRKLLSFTASGSQSGLAPQGQPRQTAAG
jgi:hypothetical protein